MLKDNNLMNQEFTVPEILKDSWKKFTDNISFIYYLLVPVFACSLLGILFFPEFLYFNASNQIDIVATLPAVLLTLVGMVVGFFSTVSLLFFFQSGKRDAWENWPAYFRLLPKYLGVFILQVLLILAGFVFVFLYFIIVYPLKGYKYGLRVFLGALSYLVFSVCVSLYYSTALGMTLLTIPSVLFAVYLAARYAFVRYRALEYPTQSIKNLFIAEAKATEGKRMVIISLGALLLFVVLFFALIFSALFPQFMESGGNPIADFLFELIITPFFTVVSILTYLRLRTPEQDSEAVTLETIKTETLEKAEAPLVTPETL